MPSEADDDHDVASLARRDNRVLHLLLAWSAALVIFILVPVFVDFSPKLVPGEFLPYSLWDVLEQCEPLVSLPLNYFILAQSDLMSRRNQRSKPKIESSERTLVKLLFLVGGALYVDGHGMHFGSKIAKHAIEQAQARFRCFQKTLYISTADSACKAAYDAYMYVRGDMEHVIGHYIYLAGAILISVAHTLAYRSHVHSYPLTSGMRTSSTSQIIQLEYFGFELRQKCTFYLAAALYALLIAGVAIEFPKGFYVVIPLMLLHGCAIVLMAVRESRTRGLDLETPSTLIRSPPPWVRVIEFLKVTFWAPTFDGRALVLQYYLAAYVIAFLPIAGWVIHVRGFVDREKSGMQL